MSRGARRRGRDGPASEPGTDAEAGGDAREIAVAVRGLTKRYGGSTALEDVTLALERGSITGLLGANGAGKTTLLKSILGLVTPTAGTVEVCDHDAADDLAGVHGAAAAVFEGARNVYWRLTARENVALFARLHGVEVRDGSDRVEEALATAGIAAEADTRVDELSRGMKQRCALACALVRQAPVLLLDEPTLGLDRAARSNLLDLLEALARESGRTILLSSHDMDVIERVCDRAVVLEDGRVVTDESVAALKAAFSTETCTVTLEGTVDEATVSTVTEDVELCESRTVRDRTELDVVLRTPDDVYTVIDRLRREGASLRSLTRTDPDLGTIFAELTEDAEGGT